MKKEELIFDNLYAKCIKEWPEVLELELKSQIKQTVVDHPDGYQLIKCEDGEWNGDTKNYIVIMNNIHVYDFCENLIKPYYYTSSEIILYSINDSIQNSIKKIAIFLKKVEICHLRAEIIKIDFENTLEKTIEDSNDESDWSKESIDLVHEYFRVNYPDAK